MTLNEVTEMLKEKLSEAERELTSAENGDKLLIETRLAFMDKDYNESEDYIGGVSTMLLAAVFVRSLANHDDEDPEFSYSIAVDLRKPEINVDELEREYLDFDSRIIDFKRRLAKTTNIESLIAAEAQDLEDEAKSFAKQVEEQVAKMKTKGGLAGVLLILILIVIVVLKTLV